MQIISNNQIVKLVLELRRRLPEEARNSIRLTDPHILERLIRLYDTHPGEAVRDLIRRIMALAGSNWIQQLNAIPAPTCKTIENSLGEENSYTETIDTQTTTQQDLTIH